MTRPEQVDGLQVPIGGDGMNLMYGIPIKRVSRVAKSHVARSRGGRGRVRRMVTVIDRAVSVAVAPDQVVATRDAIYAGEKVYDALVQMVEQGTPRRYVVGVDRKRDRTLDRLGTVAGCRDASGLWHFEAVKQKPFEVSLDHLTWLFRAATTPLCVRPTIWPLALADWA